jgi:hypothetical protein
VNPLVALAIAATAIVGVQAVSTEPAAAQSCGSIPILSTACDLATDPFEWAWDTTTGIGGEIIVGAFDYFASWVATAAVGVLGLVADGIEATTTPNLAGADGTWAISMAVARQMALPLLVVCGLYALLRRDGTVIARAAFVYLPGSVVGMVAAAWLTDQLLAAVDGFSADYAAGGASGIREFADTVAGQITAGVGITSPGLLVVFSGVLILAAMMVWLVLLVRAAAILVAYAFMPIAFAGLLLPATRGWIKRLVEIQLSFILSKLVIVGVFALATEVLSGSTNAFAAMMQASALFLLAAFSPFALMKILPFVSHEAAGALERPTAATTSMASRAAGTAAGVLLYRSLQGTQSGASSATTGGGTTGATGSPVTRAVAGGGSGQQPPPAAGGATGGAA